MNILKNFSQSLLQKLKSFMSLLKNIFTTIWNNIIYNNGENFLSFPQINKWDSKLNNILWSHQNKF